MSDPERLTEALEMWARFGPKREDNPGTPLTDLNEIVAAARAYRDLLANGERDDLSWVKRIQVLDALDKTAVEASFANPGWRLLHVGSGKGGQTTLTFGWPAPTTEEET